MANKTTMDENASAWRPGRGLLMLSMCGLLLGCLSTSTRFVTGLSADERALAAKLPVYREGLPEGSYRPLERVSGLSCQINPADNFQASEDGAMEELKRAAVSVGGNAIMGVRCESLDRGAGGHGCFRSVECHGDAVQTVAGRAN